MESIYYYDNLMVGDSWQSPARTITETDVVNFAGLTGDFDPLHIDHEFARNTPFRQPIAHGLLGLSFVAGLSSNSPRANTQAFLSIREWEFLKPIFIGDTVHVMTEVIEKHSKGRRRGIVVWRRKLVNQNEEIVQQGTFETLVGINTQSSKTPDLTVSELGLPAMVDKSLE